MELSYLTGWEHGILSTTGGGVANDWSSASVQSTTKRTGGYALRLNPTAAVCYWEKAIEGGATPNVLVTRFYVRFATLPGANVTLFNEDTAFTDFGVGFKFATNQFCTLLDGVFGTAGGPTIVTGTWYRIDAKFDTSTGTATVDAQVDGTPLTQSSGTYTSGVFNMYKVGSNSHSSTMDVFVDDLAISHDSADYPIGAGSVIGYSPDSVGTHNLEATPSAAFFTDGAGGEVAITSVETTSYTMIDDVPLNVDENRAVVKNHASLTAAHYLEYGYTNSAESGNINGVRALVVLRQDTPANCAIVARLREGGSDSTIYSGDVNNDFRVYKGSTFATKPSGGAWDLTTLNNSLLRFGFTTDADGVVRLDSSMLEVDFAEAEETATFIMAFRRG